MMAFMFQICFVILLSSGVISIPDEKKAMDGVIPPNYFFKEPGVTHDICEMEIFQADCVDDDKVILIDSARYGRITKNRCIPAWDKGEIGCNTNVLSLMNRLCSGKSTCQIRMPLQEMASLSTCSGLLRSYLEIQYSCISVLPANRQDCYLPLSVHVDREVTTISSSLMIDRGCEVINLQADPGQTLQLSIVDFMSEVDDGDSCAVKYGEIEEIDEEGEKTKVSICQGDQQEKEIFSSKFHELQILLDRSHGNFLIKVKTLGCQDITPPQGTWLRREGDKMVIGCHGNQQQTWHLTCENHRWAGVVGNCTSTFPPQETFVPTPSDSSSFKLTEKFWIFTIACISLLVCLSIVTGGVIFMKKLKLRERMLSVEQQQLQTLRPINTNTMHSEHTYAVYDRIPYDTNEAMRTSSKAGFGPVEHPLIPELNI